MQGSLSLLSPQQRNKSILGWGGGVAKASLLMWDNYIHDCILS